MNSIINALRNAPVGHDGYAEYLETVLDGAEEIENVAAVFPHAFRFFEDHAGADLGMPGPLVHFLETFFPDYVDDLCESVARKPTTHTLWMVNRILNGEISRPIRRRLVKLLRDAADDPATDQVIRDLANEFLEVQGQ